MDKNILAANVSQIVGLQEKQVQATIGLLDDGATIPFIARYRKEVTGSIDEVGIKSIRDTMDKIILLNDRREAILESLKERELLTPELEKKILNAKTIMKLEDIYLPYRPKRRTRATIAKEKGLEPLAKAIYDQNKDPLDVSIYINPEKGVPDEQTALAGASDIIAEWISEDSKVREALRTLFEKNAILQSKVIKKKEQDASKYKDYFNWHESLKQAPGHRLHAVLRGQREGFLTVHACPSEEAAISLIEKNVIHGAGESSNRVSETVKDAYRRLLLVSIEGDVLKSAREHADDEAIKVFAANIRELLMAAPLGQKIVLAIDPGFRTGCKVVALDAQGKFLHNTTIYPSLSEKQTQEAKKIILALCDTYKIEAIAVGNGTAGRETESFIRNLGIKVPIVLVNESGASIYSASDVARKEFPELDLTVRGAISIGRRLQDPLAELVKIDPKSIGVGQYQHDVNQVKLKQSLDDTVMSCVNAIGVEVNTASEPLLTYVSGIGPQLASNIVSWREEDGPFKSRKQFLKVKRLGKLAFEQAAGFLRIRQGSNLLDASAVHPERYELVNKMAADHNCTVADLLKESHLKKEISLNKYISDNVGLPTLQDIMKELDKPGRDPRSSFELFSFSNDVQNIESLKVGMKLPGIITNVTNFGAFVDIGVHQDGLVHISQLSDRFVKDPLNIVQVSQKVKVTVVAIDIPRKRISLSMKKQP